MNKFLIGDIVNLRQKSSSNKFIIIATNKDEVWLKQIYIKSFRVIKTNICNVKMLCRMQVELEGE